MQRNREQIPWRLWNVRIQGSRPGAALLSQSDQSSIDQVGLDEFCASIPRRLVRSVLVANVGDTFCSGSSLVASCPVVPSRRLSEIEPDPDWDWPGHQGRFGPPRIPGNQSLPLVNAFKEIQHKKKIDASS